MTSLHHPTIPIEVTALQKILPQTYPMLMLDRVVDYVPSQQATAIKNVSINESFFQGHFPEHPVMPGVLILEAMAQVAGVVGFLTKGKFPSDNFTYVFAGADKVRFKRKVIPGDQLLMTAKFLASRQGVLKFTCVAVVDEEVVASAEITIAEQSMDTL